MSDNTARDRPHLAEAGIIVLLVLTAVMLFSMFSRTAPHPPFDIAPFSLGPFLGASLALGAAALHLVMCGARHARSVALIFVFTALVSFGPQKYLDPGFARIWPAVAAAQVAMAVVLFWSLPGLRRGEGAS